MMKINTLSINDIPETVLSKVTDLLYGMEEEEAEKIFEATSNYFWHESKAEYNRGYKILKKYAEKIPCSVAEFYIAIDYITY